MSISEHRKTAARASNALVTLLWGASAFGGRAPLVCEPNDISWAPEFSFASTDPYPGCIASAEDPWRELISDILDDVRGRDSRCLGDVKIGCVLQVTASDCAARILSVSNSCPDKFREEVASLVEWLVAEFGSDRESDIEMVADIVFGIGLQEDVEARVRSAYILRSNASSHCTKLLYVMLAASLYTCQRLSDHTGRTVRSILESTGRALAV